MGPSTILTVITVVISISAFSNREILNRLILSPYVAVHHKQWYRIITHAFIHADWTHLLFNAIALWSFGSAVEYYFSLLTASPGLYFYTMYFIAILISSAPDIIKQRNNSSYLSLGASGAVSAVIFSAIFFDPWNKILIFFVPCPGIIFGILYLVYSSYMSKKGGDNINHGAHFYGSIFGLIFPLLIEPKALHYFIERLMHPTFF